MIFGKDSADLPHTLRVFVALMSLARHRYTCISLLLPCIVQARIKTAAHRFRLLTTWKSTRIHLMQSRMGV